MKKKGDISSDLVSCLLIPKVKRHDYIIKWRYLIYLKLIEEVGCCYWGCFTKLI